MRILWITNAPLPEALDLLQGNKHEMNGTGSWILALANSLINSANDIKLIVASPCNNVKKLTKLFGKKIDYYLLPAFNSTEFYHPEYEEFWKKIKKADIPDIVHIHGTEYPHGLAYINSCGNENVVVSIQGLISEITKVYLGGIDKKILKKYNSIRDVLRGDTLFAQQSRMRNRVPYEIEILSKIKYAIGRTNWDKKILTTLNPGLTYFFCNETLRKEFYYNKWSYETCKPHSIYVVQGNYPIKGLHFLLQALPYVIKKYPDTTVRVSGVNIMRGSSLKDKLLRSGYANYLSDLMRINKISNKIQFIGNINSVKVKQEMLQCNTFVLPSAIENSPNSLGEAQLLGVPCVASNVGGIPTMIPNENCGMMYSYDDIEALAVKIIKTFDESVNFDNNTMRETSYTRHDSSTNLKQLLHIYQNIIDNAANK